jgi:UDP-glucuronate 4-epimerase
LRRQLGDGGAFDDDAGKTSGGAYVISLLEKQFGRVAEKEMLPMQPGRRRSHLRRHHGSGTRHIGFRPATNIEDGIAHFAKWYREFHKI